jgi:hypothetical protein
MSCLRSLIEASMEECMFVLMVETLELSCFTSCWVSMKIDCMVLKRASKYWLWVWGWAMGHDNEGTKTGRVGSKSCCKTICTNVIRVKR